MATLDIFNNDAFGLVSLSETMVDIPTPLMNHSALFAEEGINQLTVAIERQGASLKLVPNRPRGAPGEPVHLGPRKLITFPTFHLPQQGAVMADEVLGIRVFGTESEQDAVLNLVRRKLAVAKERLDATIEYQRMGAIRGQILDFDGSTVLLDIYQEFGLTKTSYSFELDVDSTNIRNKIVGLKRLIEAAMGGVSFSGITAEVSSEFFDELTSHPQTMKAFEQYQQNAFARNDPRNTFEMAGVRFIETSGSVNGVPFMPTGKGYAYPTGVPNLFKTYYAPAPYMETVGTQGLPYYVKQQPMEYNKGIEFETQSNPLSLNHRPEATVEITITD